jgi:DNA (cytosine-5)-methyltransferase 1
MHNIKTHGSLFSGIGGFDLAAEWMGWENVFHCEWMEFPRKVLDYYWPNADSHIDICKTDFKKYANKIDILTGGFPCQPFSMAGKRKGTDDERYLWGEMLRAIQEIKPKYVIAENVFGITNIDGGLVFEQVCLDLEAEGYEVQPFVVPACAKNAPHRRDRVWFVAYNQHNGNRRREQQQESEQEKNRAFKNTGSNGCSNGEYDKQISKRNEWEFGTGSKERIFVGEALQNDTNTNCNGSNQCNSNDEINTSQRRQYALGNAEQGNGNGNATNTEKQRLEGMRRKERGHSKLCRGQNGVQKWQNFPTQSPICSGDDGLPTELDGITFSKWRAESIKGYGNAIVPQVAFELFKQLCNHASIK